MAKAKNIPPADYLCAQPAPVPVVLPEGLTPPRLEAIWIVRNKWVNGTNLHYCFLTDDAWSWPEDEKEVVRWAFRTWKELPIGLIFVETSDPYEAEIRIGALKGDGSWSYVGTDILKYKNPERTMNFGWDLTTEWGHATALHETGHTLGLPHEHQNPQAGIVWDEDEVYQQFSGAPNKWKRDKIFYNIIRKLTSSEIEGSNWDPTSIMHYPFGPGLIKTPKPYDRNGVGRNVALSAGDKDWARRFYPDGTTPVPISAMQFERLDAVAGQQRDYVFDPPATREYTIQTIGASDCKIVVFEERDGVSRHLAAEDDSGYETNATIKEKFVKGRRYIIRVRVHYISSPDGVGLIVH